jgi:hypothetical protein
MGFASSEVMPVLADRLSSQGMPGPPGTQDGWSGRFKEEAIPICLTEILPRAIGGRRNRRAWKSKGPDCHGFSAAGLTAVSNRMLLSPNWNYTAVVRVLA